MNAANRDIDELIAGMIEAANGCPSEAVERKISELRAEQERNTRTNWHGWECYCYECCQ